MTRMISPSSFVLFTFPIIIFIFYIGTLYTSFVYLLYFFFACKKPTIYYSKTKKNVKLIEKMKILKQRFFPFIFAIPGFIQTYTDRIRRKKIKIKESIKLNTKDGGSFIVDIFQKGNEKKSVILVHGFNSSSDSSYIRNLAFHFVEIDYRVFGFNSRGTKCKLQTPIFFHIGWTEDLKFCLEHVLDNYEGEIALIGFSLGGNWVAKLLGENNMLDKKFKRIKCGMGISIPFCFFELNKIMSNWAFKISINRLLARKMKSYLYRNAEIISKAGVDMDALTSCNTVHEIDECVTKKIFKIDNLEEHYKNSSCSAYLPFIKIPFMIINSCDDPIIPFKTIPIEKCINNENIILVVTKNGGHIGFMSYDLDKNYVENVVIDFVTNFIDN
ncbi:hypothetical protein GVAV_003529 [Gurleya vavrai]